MQILAAFSFFEFITGLPFGIIGIGLIVLTFYVKIIDIKFKKNGVPVKVKVKKCEKIPDMVTSEEVIINGYETVFEFEFKGAIIERKINTAKKYKIGTIKKGIFRETNDSNDLIVGTDGFYLFPGGEFVILTFGIVFTFVFISSFIDIPDKYIVYISIFTFVVCFGFIYLKDIFKALSKKSKRNKKYYDIIDDNKEKLSQVDSNLIRYIPKQKTTVSNKANIASVVISIMFLIFGIILIKFSISEIRNDFNIEKNYLTTTAVIKQVYKSKRYDEETEVKIVRLIYEFEIDNIKYNLEEKIESSSVFSNIVSYKVGDTKKIYYKKSNPNIAINKTLYKFGTSMLIIGVLFIFISIYLILREIRKIRLYKNYIIAKEKIK